MNGIDQLPGTDTFTDQDSPRHHHVSSQEVGLLGPLFGERRSDGWDPLSSDKLERDSRGVLSIHAGRSNHQ